MLAWKFPPGKGLFTVELNYGRTKKITFGEAFSSFFFFSKVSLLLLKSCFDNELIMRLPSFGKKTQLN